MDAFAAAPPDPCARRADGPSEDCGNVWSVTTGSHEQLAGADPALAPLARLARWVGACEAAGGESGEARGHVEDALAQLRSAWTEREPERRPELTRAVTSLVARRPPDEAVHVRPRGVELEDALDRLGVRRLRPGQDRAIAAALAGRDSLVIMATGSGKSLCYQAPAAVLQGLTVVISPLIALMTDQLAGLERAGISAAALNSSMADDEQRDVLARVAAGDLSLLYVAPERFNSAGFRRALARVGVDLLVVDEAHCVSEWGHEFRPDYRRVGAFREELRPRATMALTATAAERVRRDIVARVGMDVPTQVVGGFDRPNIAFDAMWVEGKGSVARRRALLHAVLGPPGGGKAIVYCGTRRAAEETAEDLAGAGYAAVAYHAGRADRAQAQEAFTSGAAQVVAATNAFGMGVNVPDVRLVVHTTLPDSLEQLYQEAGRAGRDGELARHVILAGPADEAGARRRIARARIGVGEVESLIATLAHGADADGGFMLPRGRVDDETDAHLALAERVGALSLTGAPGGGRAGFLRLERLGPDEREELGSLVRAEVNRRHRGLDAAAAYVREDTCRRAALLVHFDDHAEPAPEDRCCDHCDPPADLAQALERIERAPERVRRGTASSAVAALERLSAEERVRYDALRAWRAATAAAIGWPAFRVSPNRTLAGIAVADPRDAAALGAVHGVGPWLMETYGDAVLDVLRDVRAAG